MAKHGSRSAVGPALSLALVFTALGALAMNPVTGPAGAAEPPPPLPNLVDFKAAIDCLAFSPDGKSVWTGGGEFLKAGLLVCWDVETGKERYSVSFPDSHVQVLAVSADGKLLATGGYGGELKLFDAATGKEKCQLIGHEHSLKDVCFSADGKRLATRALDDRVKVWDVARGKPRLSLHYLRTDDDGVKREGLPEGKAPVNIEVATPVESLYSVALSPDGTILAVATAASTLVLRDATTGQEISTLDGGKGFEALRVAFSPDGKTLAVGGGPDDGRIMLWDPQTGKSRGVLRGHGSTVLAMSFSSDGKRLLTGSMDQTAKLWDVKNRLELRTFPGDKKFPVYEVALSPDGKTALMTTWHRVRLLEADTGKGLRPDY